MKTQGLPICWEIHGTLSSPDLGRSRTTSSLAGNDTVVPGTLFCELLCSGSPIQLLLFDVKLAAVVVFAEHLLSY